MIKISDILNGSLSEKSGCGTVSRAFNLHRIWKRATTEHIANVTTPLKVSSDGVLQVLVHDGVWFTELNYLQDDIVQRLNNAGLNVKSVKFKNCPYLQKYEAPKAKPFPLGDRENFYIEKCSGVIDNDKVKESFEKAMKAYFSRHGFEKFING